MWQRTHPNENGFQPQWLLTKLSKKEKLSYVTSCSSLVLEVLFVFTFQIFHFSLNSPSLLEMPHPLSALAHQKAKTTNCRGKHSRILYCLHLPKESLQEDKAFLLYVVSQSWHKTLIGKKWTTSWVQDFCKTLLWLYL